MSTPVRESLLPPLMRVVQYHCNYSQATSITAFERAKLVRANIVWIPELYVDRGILSHPAFNIRCRMVE